MYKNNFDNHLSSGTTFDAYMFWGQSEFFVESYAKRVALSLGSSEDIQKIYFEEYNYKSCLDILSSSSLFSSANIVLLKTTKKIPKKDLDNLIKASNVNSSSHLVIACMGDGDFKAMAKSFTTKTNSVEVRFFTPNTSEAMAILNEYAKKAQVNFAQGGLIHLYEMHEKNLALCLNDIEKLSILDEEITAKVVTNQCFGMGAVSLDDFLIKLFSQQPINAMLYKLLEEGINEIYLINQIISFAQQLFMINTYLKLYGSLDIIKIWGYPLPRDIANQRANIATKFSQTQFSEILNFLLNLELELKTQKFPDTNAYLQSCMRNFIQYKL